MPVLKMLSRRKASSVLQLLTYVSREADNTGVAPILYNLRSNAYDHKAIAKEFLENEAYRKVTKNRLYSYHTILSLGEGDKGRATPEIMQAITQKYLELRGDILAYAIAHNDSNAPHVHICESATLYREGKSSALRKVELEKIKLELEHFVQEKFPELEHSRVEHGKGRAYTKEAEYQLQKRTGISERESLKQLIHQAYQIAQSKQHFLEILLDRGYIHYERNADGTPTGLVSEFGRKYRFKTLGISPEQIMSLETSKEQSTEKDLLDQLNQIRKTHHPKIPER